MCGINGIYAYHYAATLVDYSELVRTRDYMSARGPDGKGDWISKDRRFGLGHRRLSIIDITEAGTQPMASADGTYVVTFNGEIYNYKALRHELEARGRVFQSRTDTEVLLHLYAEKGESMVYDLRGMFAFGLWDANRQALLLARDPYGIKPLYYADNGRTLRFASQVKALVAGGQVSMTQDAAGWVGFFLFGSVPEPFTTYNEIRALPAGSIVWTDTRGVREPKKYFSIAETYYQRENKVQSLDSEGLHSYVREALLDSVRHHLIADVPVGAFLSGGVDSSALVGLMRDVGQEDIQTVTLIFDEFRGKPDDESTLSTQIAAQYCVRHTTRLVTEQEFLDDLPRIREAMDQPTIDGVNTWFIAKAVRELGLKVAISGLGGDELFGGYASFHDLPRWVRLLTVSNRIPFLAESFRIGVSALVSFSKRINPKAAGMVKYGGSYAGAYLLRRGLFMPWELELVLKPDMVREGLERLRPLDHINKVLHPTPRSVFSKVATLESSLYMRNQLLRDSDWASMAHGLEIRVPLVDVELLRQIAGYISVSKLHNRKELLAAAPSVPVMSAILNREKKGFTTPVDIWLERNTHFGLWRKKRFLRSAGCPWARRWAYEVAEA